MKVGSQSSLFWFSWWEATIFDVCLMIGRRYWSIGRWRPDYSNPDKFPTLNTLGFTHDHYYCDDVWGGPAKGHDKGVILRKPCGWSYFHYSSLFGYWVISSWKKGF